MSGKPLRGGYNAVLHHISALISLPITAVYQYCALAQHFPSWPHQYPVVAVDSSDESGWCHQGSMIGWLRRASASSATPPPGDQRMSHHTPAYFPVFPVSVHLAGFAITLALDGLTANSQRSWHLQMVPPRTTRSCRPQREQCTLQEPGRVAGDQPHAATTISPVGFPAGTTCDASP